MIAHKGTSASRGKSHITLKSKRFLDKDLQRVVTDYNSLSATGDLKMADYDIPVYPGTMRYNPRVEDHGIIIGCLVFYGLLMYIVYACI